MKYFAFVVLTLAVSLNVAQAADDDNALWTILSTADRIRSDGENTRWRYTATAQWRAFQRGNGSDQYLLRGSIGYDLRPDVRLSLGYDYFRTDPDGGSSKYERRPWQQLAWTARRWDWGSLLLRWRLEERDLEGASDTGIRFRQMAQITRPLVNHDVTTVYSVELFANVNDTDAGARSGLDQLRAYAGLRMPMTDKTSLEAGYMLQHINRPSGRDFVNHTGMLHLRIRFR